jgi:hypothetical protein
VAAVALAAGQGCSSSATSLPDQAAMPTRSSATADRARLEKSMAETQSAAGARQSQAIGAIEKSK